MTGLYYCHCRNTKLKFTNDYFFCLKENFKISTVPFPIFCAILNNIGAFVV